MKKSSMKAGILLTCALMLLCLVKAPVYASGIGSTGNIMYVESTNDDITNILGETDPDDTEEPSEPEYPVNQWVQDETSGNWYYYNSEREKVTGWLNLNGAWYYMNSDGTMQTGWQKIENKWYYLKTSGSMLTGWQQINNKWYYFGGADSGAMRSGWQQINNKWYYFGGVDSGAMRSGWQKVDGKWYYLGTSNDGAMKTGWQQVNGKWYYLNGSGSMQTGWIKPNLSWYYLNGSGAMMTGWQQVDGKWYYMDASGAMTTGWQKVDGKWYYLDAGGSMVTGWIALRGNWYYLYSSGAMAYSTTIEGYKLGSDGVMIVGSSQKEMTQKAQSYSSDTGYLILVNRKACKTAVFTGGKDNWTCKFFWDCSPGAASTPTVSGTYKVAAKGYYFDADGGARCFYYTQFYGNYLFHSVLYNKNGKLIDGRLGMQLSHGCVRLKLENAKWIYDNIPRNTKVVIY